MKVSIKATAVVLLSVSCALVLPACTQKRETGNVLRVAVREKYKSLDPVMGGEFYSNVAISRAYEGLYQYHYLKRPYQIEPMLAESLPRVSADGRVYTIAIRKGVRFQDDSAFGASGGKGRELTASDVVFSLKRLADPKIGTAGWWILDGKIEGLNAWRERTAKAVVTDYDFEVAGLKALDASTLQIVLTRPNARFVDLLTLPMTYVVPREAVEFYRGEFSQHPVGTGPFRLVHVLANQLIWEKNPTFRLVTFPSGGNPEDSEAGLLADAGKPLPFVDKIVDDIVIEDSPAWLNFMQGNHDYLMRIPKDNAIAVIDSEGKPKAEFRQKGIKVLVTPMAEFTYFGFNMEDPVVGGAKNRFLREAMALAYDEAPTITKFYLGLATRAESPIIPSVAGYDPGYRNPTRKVDLVKAREILAKNGHAGGEGIPEIVLDTTSSLARRQLAEYFQRQMAQLGVRVKLNVSPWPEFIGRIRKRQAQMFDINWLYDYPDAENAWQILYGRNVSPGSNESNYSSADFDKLYEKMAGMQDGPERRRIFAKMNEIFARDIPWILGVHRFETRLVHPWLRNYKIHAFDYNLERYLRVDPEARKKALR